MLCPSKMDYTIVIAKKIASNKAGTVDNLLYSLKIALSARVNKEAWK